MDEQERKQREEEQRREIIAIKFLVCSAVVWAICVFSTMWIWEGSTLEFYGYMMFGMLAILLSTVGLIIWAKSAKG